MTSLKLVFYMLCFFIIFMYILGIDKSEKNKNSMEHEKGKILKIFATIFLVINIILGYNIYL